MSGTQHLPIQGKERSIRESSRGWGVGVKSGGIFYYDVDLNPNLNFRSALPLAIARTLNTNSIYF